MGIVALLAVPNYVVAAIATLGGRSTQELGCD